jgi:hypothetical protein
MFNQSYAAARFCGSKHLWSAFFLMGWAILSSPGNLNAQAPAITQPPVEPTVFLGDPTTLQVIATGNAPLAYQWFRDDAPLAGASSSSYNISSVQAADHNASFFVRITNSFGAVTSAPVTLKVDFGVPGAAVTNRVLNFNNAWRYNLSNNLDAVNWTAPAYNDAAWPTGGGLLAAENNAAITPLVGTTLPAPNAPPPGLSQGHAYYFRHTLNVASNNLIPGALIATLRADDGAMIYVNGTEALRLRLPAGPVTNTSFATGFPLGANSDATVDEVLPLDVISLAPGNNTIAVSVHQANATSSDLVWGMALDVVGYQRLRDTVSPTVTSLSPAANSVLPAMSSLEVVFSEGVKGVTAGDLLINGVAATNVIAYADDVYLFQFPPQPIGPVQVAWAAGHGILDRSANSNAFGGGTYSYSIDPQANAFRVRINEFMAANTATILDNDGDYSDWIELYNAGNAVVDLSGWYLTDNVGNPTKWRFPTGLTLPPDSYLLVWASDKDRKNLAAPLHTNFKLSKSAGNFLGLVYADGLTVISSFTNYPIQSDDVSFGRDRLDAAVLGYFDNPTPGTVNATSGSGFLSPVQFSRASGTFQTPFQLTLTTTDSNTVIRYFLVTNAASAALTNVPHSGSPVYTAPLSVSSSVQVRARAFSTLPNVFPSEPTSETFLQINAGAAGFASDLPIVLLYNFSGATPPATTDQNGVMMVFDTKYGRAALTNPPALTTRIGLNIRGSSSQDFAKKSFAVEAWDEFNDDANVSVLDLPAESDWVLYAPNYYDKPWIHNPLMHELSRSIGRYSPRTRLAEVFTCFTTSEVIYSSPAVGNYNGIYVVTEKIKADANRVDLPRLEPTQTNSPTITGGYLLKIDRRDADEREFNAGNQTMVFVEPQMKDYSFYPGRALQQNYLAGYFNSFYSALTGGNWTNPVTGYAAWIDVDAWVDHHLMSVFSLSCDALRLSAYFYKNREQKIEMGPLWDFDRALGTSAGNDWRAWNPRSWMGSNPYSSSTSTDYGTDYFNASGTFANPWYSRLLQDPNFWQKWIDRYQTLRDTELSTNALFGIIGSLTNQLAVAQTREMARWADSLPRSGTVIPPGTWPDRSYSHSFPGTYAGEIAFLKRWIGDRLNFIDTNLLARPTLNLTSGPVSIGQSVTLTPAGKANTRLLYTLNGTDPRLPGGAISPVALSNNGPVTLIITSNIAVFARSWNPTHQNLTGAKNPPISSPWSGPATASYYTTIPALRITEIMYNPPPPPVGNTNDADNFEFIELQNTGATPINLQGAKLGGGIEFTFPSLTLTGGQFVVVAKHLAAFQSRYGTAPLVAGSFTNNLANGGDHVTLNGPLGEPILDFSYSDEWYPTTDGEGFSLVIINPAAARESWSVKSGWRPSTASGGSPGASDPAPASIPGILISEALTHTDPPLLDSIELFNPTINNVNLGGWFLTDDPHDPKKYRIPDNTFISAGGYLTFTTDQFGVGPKGFAFGSTGDSVYVFSGDANTNLTGYAHGYTFGAAPNPVSFGRYVNSQQRELFVRQSLNTLGQRNAYPGVGPVAVTEIMYHPPDLAGGVDDDLNEFIELQNITSANVPLYDVNHPENTWRLRDAVDFDFPPGLVLTPGQRALVVGFDPNFYGSLKASLMARYNIPTNTLILGPWSGKLDNRGDTIELERPDNPNVTVTGTTIPYYAVEKIAYADTLPWPSGADGEGDSLQRLEATLFANDPVNWQAAAPTAAQPNPAGPTVDIDSDGLPDAWELANNLDPQIGSGGNGADSDLDSDGATNLEEYIAGTNPQDANDYLRFSEASNANQNCRLKFLAKTGRIYAVEFSNTLGNAPAWQTLTNGIVGSNEVITITDPQTSTRYYRLRVGLN